MIWLIVASYLLGYLLSWRRIAWVMAHEGNYGPLEGDDIAFGVVFGFIVSFAWPVIVPGYFLYRSGLLTSGSHALLKAPKHIRDKERIATQERRIAELEREVGIR